MTSIYRKYRPKTFAEMVGQNHIKITLSGELETDKIAHAYLFCGPRGLGKTTAARLLAKAINCLERKKGDVEPCNKCLSCEEINNNRSLDIMEIDAASHTGVDNVRESIIENARFVPSRAKYKVFIIDEVHMLSPSAFNALLKTLEEPPSYVVFILCTTEIHKVPETIISRCQRFDFRKLPPSDMIKRLKDICQAEKVMIDNDVYKIIAARSDGCMRDAESLLGQILSLGGSRITKDQASLVLPLFDIGLVIDFLDLVSAKQISQALDFINQLVENGVDLEVFIKDLLDFSRRLVLVKVGAKGIDFLDWGEENIQRINKILLNIELPRWIFFVSLLFGASQDTKTAVISQWPLELAVIKMIENSVVANQSTLVEENKKIIFKNPAILKHQENNNNGVDIHENGEINVQKNIEKISDNSEPAVNQFFEEDQGVMAQIIKEWPQIIKTGHERSRELLFINDKMVWPFNFNGDELTIGFKYDLHKSRFDSSGTAEVFREIVGDYLKKKIKIRAKTLKASEVAEIEAKRMETEHAVMPVSEISVMEETNVLDAVLDSFGGEVVEDENQ